MKKNEVIFVNVEQLKSVFDGNPDNHLFHPVTIIVDRENGGKVVIPNLSQKDVFMIGNTIAHYCYNQQSNKTKFHLTIHQIKEMLLLWTPSFLRRKP